MERTGWPMNKYGLIGEKLGHSFSARIHKELGGYDYSLLEFSKDQVENFLKSKEFNAVNITIPYKQYVMQFLDEISEEARAIGAVNTIVNSNGKLIGNNTDFGGMLALIERFDISLNDKRVAVLGSGGTAHTAAAVARHLSAAEIFIVSRNPADGCISYDELFAMRNSVDVIINTTPCGMYPNIGVSAVDIADYPNLSGVVDAVYNPLATKLVADANAKGIPACGGLYMLVAQAALAVEYFCGKKVPCEDIEKTYFNLMSSLRNIVLIGMPGCGKSTIGNNLSQKLGRELVDTDDMIVRSHGIAIPEIFAQKGEEYFRSAESAAIKEISARQGLIIATGGGAVLRRENVELLRENGVLVFLDRRLEDIAPTADRPLSSDREALELRYKERYPIYSSACDIKIDCGHSAEENVLMIIKELLI
ncbi:MAG: shikimate dehydrogenase [Clostridia bacterium]|nr:shikimate dehydrogenase [Clostridia bacterium]